MPLIGELTKTGNKTKSEGETGNRDTHNLLKTGAWQTLPGGVD